MIWYFYAAIILHILFLICIGYVVGVICPQFASLLEHHADQLTWTTKAIVSVSHYQMAPWVWLAIFDYFILKFLHNVLTPSNFTIFMVGLVPIYILSFYLLISEFYQPLETIINRYG